MTNIHSTSYENNTNEQYMVLYNGNAEVIGNFRALNFYKASDINIKEDIRLLSYSKELFSSPIPLINLSYHQLPSA